MNYILRNHDGLCLDIRLRLARKVTLDVRLSICGGAEKALCISLKGGSHSETMGLNSLPPRGLIFLNLIYQIPTLNGIGTMALGNA
jgi:hypothetical protein